MKAFLFETIIKRGCFALFFMLACVFCMLGIGTEKVWAAPPVTPTFTVATNPADGATDVPINGSLSFDATAELPGLFSFRVVSATIYLYDTDRSVIGTSISDPSDGTDTVRSITGSMDLSSYAYALEPGTNYTWAIEFLTTYFLTDDVSVLFESRWTCEANFTTAATTVTPIFTVTTDPADGATAVPIDGMLSFDATVRLPEGRAAIADDFPYASIKLYEGDIHIGEPEADILVSEATGIITDTVRAYVTGGMDLSALELKPGIKYTWEIYFIVGYNVTDGTDTYKTSSYLYRPSFTTAVTPTFTVTATPADGATDVPINGSLSFDATAALPEGGTNIFDEVIATAGLYDEDGTLIYSLDSIGTANSDISQSISGFESLSAAGLLEPGANYTMI